MGSEDILFNEKNFNFAYRVSAVIFNKEKTKILLFYGNDMDYYMLPGGKVRQMEKSQDAIKREILEELGFDNLDFELLGISEEIIKEKEQNIHQITLTYKCIYNGEILQVPFKSKETDWINFKWVNIEDIANYSIHPTNVLDFIKEKENIKHIVEERCI